MSDRVTIVIVSYHSAKDLARCLPTIPTASATPTPTIIVNNATGDDSIRRMITQFPWVRLIESPENLGYGAAVNKAVRETPIKSDWILILNPDSEFTPGSLDELVSAAETNPEVGSAGPKILNDDGTVYPSARAVPSLGNGIGHALFKKLWPRNPWTRAYQRGELAAASRTPAETGWLSGACVLVKTRGFEHIGGFDERFFMYMEDVDLGERLHNAGYANLYVPSAIITHVGAQSTQHISKEMRAVHHRSAYLYLAKRYPQWYFWPLRIVLRLGLTVRNAVGL